jgi:hypothetical protein
MDLVQPDRRND